jgi:class 3 adenylate cyclase
MRYPWVLQAPESSMSETPQRKLAAIMFSDMKGFSSQMDADEIGTMEILRKHNAVMEMAVDAHSGRVIKTIGDAYMVEFTSTVNAVACALDVQRRFSDLNLDYEDGGPFLVRIGIHVGDVVLEGSDLFGEAVNVAARLEPKAPVGGVCVSEAVYAQVRRKVHAVGKDMGFVELKNISQPMRLFALRPSSEHLDILSLHDISTERRSEPSQGGGIGKIVAALLLLGLCGGGAFAAWKMNLIDGFGAKSDSEESDEDDGQETSDEEDSSGGDESSEEEKEESTESQTSGSRSSGNPAIRERAQKEGSGSRAKKSGIRKKTPALQRRAPKDR